MIRGGAVDLDVSGLGFLPEVVSKHSFDGDAAVGDPSAGFAAAAITEIGEKLIEAAHWGEDQAGE